MKIEPIEVSADANVQAVRPDRLAHFVLRSSRYRETADWYRTVFNAWTVYEDDLLTFLTYDEEHHRIALLNVPDLAEQQEGVAGMHHVAFTYASMADLLATYERLRDIGIKPVFTVNHGPTTSLYYADPDGNQIELQIDNYDTVEEATEFFFSQAFRTNPIGVEFDPDELLARFRGGVPERELKARPDDGARGLSDIKLR